MRNAYYSFHSVMSDISTQVLLLTDRVFEDSKISAEGGLQSLCQAETQSCPSPEKRRKSNSLLAASPALDGEVNLPSEVDLLLFNKAGTGVHGGIAPLIVHAGGGMHLLGRVAAGGVLRAAGISPTRLEMHLVSTGGSPRLCWCRAVVQWDGLWPVRYLMLISSVAVLCYIVTGGLQWPSTSGEKKLQHWEDLNLLVLLQTMVLSSFLENFLGKGVGNMLLFPKITCGCLEGSLCDPPSPALESVVQLVGINAFLDCYYYFFFFRA